jgi:predicted  nucleic acid-binding Zn-ribbon protein
VSAGRAALIDGIPPDLLAKYSTLFAVRGGVAVCAVEGDVCTGCYTSITPNDQARLLGASSIVQCGSCQRMLYFPET